MSVAFIYSLATIFFCSSFKALSSMEIQSLICKVNIELVWSVSVVACWCSGSVAVLECGGPGYVVYIVPAPPSFPHAKKLRDFCN